MITNNGPIDSDGAKVAVGRLDVLVAEQHLHHDQRVDLGTSAGQVFESREQHASEGGSQQVRGGLEPAGQTRLAHGSLIGVLARGCTAGVDEQGIVLGDPPLASGACQPGEAMAADVAVGLVEQAGRRDHVAGLAALANDLDRVMQRG